MYQTYQASRKTETTPTDEPAAATSPQVTTETKTLVEVTPPTQQTASYVGLTTGAEQVVGGTAVGQKQSVAPPLATSPPPPPPALPATKVVVCTIDSTVYAIGTASVHAVRPMQIYTKCVLFECIQG